MSQGRRKGVEPELFIPAKGVYAHIPKQHFYQQLAAVLDLSFLYELTKPLYADGMGRPSLDPVVFFKCLLVGFFEGIEYFTELEFRLADSLLVRQFIGYSLAERTPDESTLRKTYGRMPVEAFERVGAEVREVCTKHGLLRGRALGTDSTLVDANAGLGSLRHRELGCSFKQYMAALRKQLAEEQGEEASSEKPPARRVRNQDWVSQTDPEARLVQHRDGRTHLGYRLDATVDLETGVIVQAGAELGEVSDQVDCLQRVDEAAAALAEQELAAQVVVADKGHHSGENLAGLAERGAVALIASPGRPAAAEGFRQEDFQVGGAGEYLTCPAGERLPGRVKTDRTGTRCYQAPGRVCRACPHFGVCTKSKAGRKVRLSEHAALMEANWQRIRSEAARPVVRIRGQRGEAPFAYMKGFGGLRRLAGRGLDYATKRVLVAAMGWNLLLVIKKLDREGHTGGLVLLRRLLSALWGLIQALLRPWGQSTSVPPPNQPVSPVSPACLQN